MKIVFIVYHDLKTEARSQDTLKALEEIGDVTVVSQNDLPDWSNSKSIVVPYEQKKKGIRYINFLKKAKSTIVSEKPDLVFLHDAPELITYTKQRFPMAKIVCDQSELMIDRKNTNIRMFILKIMGELYRADLKKADLIICANEERAIITQFYYSLPHKPFVFENIHRIDDPYNIDELSVKYISFISPYTHLIVYGGGVSKARKTYDLVEAITNIDNVKLIIAGANPEGLETLNALINNYSLQERVKYIGFVPRSEWRYLLSIADISFVAFERNCWNNIYCASGKAFESLFEGTPILCSSNPPLQRLCETEHVGVATDDIGFGISTIVSDMDYFKNNAIRYANTLDYESRIDKLTQRIKGVL